MSDDAPLITAANIDDPDGFYAQLIKAHRGLDPAASRQLNARLILLLANHVGDRAILDAALAHARVGLDPAPSDTAEGGQIDPHAGE